MITREGLLNFAKYAEARLKREGAHEELGIYNEIARLAIKGLSADKLVNALRCECICPCADHEPCDACVAVDAYKKATRE